jgi:hypothetical protein
MLRPLRNKRRGVQREALDDDHRPPHAFSVPLRAAFGPLAFSSPILLAATVVHAAPSVWVIDDGEKIRRDAISTPFERGELNPVWGPGAPVRLFALRNESLAIQVVVEADDAPLAGVTVALPELEGPAGARMVEEGVGRPDVLAGPIRRFIEHFIIVRRASGGRTAGESLGWEKGAAPPSAAWVGAVPDPLIPVEASAPWAAYPMRIAPHTNGIVWIDLNVPRQQPAGAYRGVLTIRNSTTTLTKIPVELDVADATLPDRPVATALFYDPQGLSRRVGGGAEEQLWKLLHAHRIAPLHDSTSVEDVLRQRDALDGTLYTSARGYDGPGAGAGDDVLSLGAYGAFGPPNDQALASVRAVADAVAEASLFESTEVFLYAADERCTSPWGDGWRRLLHGAADTNLRRVSVAWTCADDPYSQPVDIPIVPATLDVARVRAARDRGKRVWVYNGILPHSGTFLLDADAVSPRVNGWLAAMFEIGRWFYWESTFWYGPHGATPIDPFAEPESLHNGDGDWANGDGVLLYPGRQLDGFAEHSLGFEGVVASIRLKNWRRGIEDAGYLQLARVRDREAADAIARSLIPSAFGNATTGRAPSWSPRGKPFHDARSALRAIALGAPVELRTLRRAWSSEPRAEAGGAFAVIFAVALLALLRTRWRV